MVTEASRVASATVSAPGAGAVVAQIVAPPDGLYDVTVKVFLSGTAETALNNLRLRENGNTVFSGLPSITVATDWLELKFANVEVNQGGGNLDVIAIAAATAGSVYSVVLIADRRV